MVISWRVNGLGINVWGNDWHDSGGLRFVIRMEYESRVEGPLIPFH